MAEEQKIPVGIEVNQQSFSQLEQRAAQSFDQISRMAQANAAVASTASQAEQASSRAFDAIQASAKNATVAVEQLQKEMLDSKATADLLQKSGSGGGIGVEGLRRTGGALTQLGFGEVGGLVQRAGDIGQIAKEADALSSSLGSLGAALPVVGGAVIGFQLGLKVLDAELADGKRQLEASVAGVKTYYDAISTGTTKSVQDQVKALQDKNKAELAELETLKTARDNAAKAAIESGDIVQQAALGAGKLTGAFKATDDRIAELEKSTTSTAGQISSLNTALNDGSLAANDAAEAEKKLADVRIAAFQNQLDVGIQVQQLIEKGDKKAAQDAIASREAELAGINKFLEANAERVAGDEKLAESFEAAEERAKKLRAEIDQLTHDALPALENQAKHTNASMDADIERQMQGPTGRARAEAAAKDLEARDARLAADQKKFNDAAEQTERQSLQKRADIQKQYGDKLVEIARQTAEESANALKQLERTQTDDLTSLQRDQQKIGVDGANQDLKLRIDFQRKEAQEDQAHYQEVLAIQKNARDQELGFLLNRNFLGLYQSRLQASADIERSNTQFTQRRQQEVADLKNQEDDLRTSLAQQRQARLVAYTQQIQDAKLAYSRQIQDSHAKEVEALAVARQGRDENLRDLQTKTSQELRIKKAAYDAELKLDNLYGDARVQAEAKTQQALLNQANQRLQQIASGASGGSTHELARRAGGGDLAAFQLSEVNEGYPGQREAFNGIPLPSGAGLFLPFQAGNISQAGSPNVTIQQTYSIDASGITDVNLLIKKILPTIRDETAKAVEFVTS